MSHTSAWEALAKCFSSLAPSHDLNLWGYGVRHPPDGVELRSLRRVWWAGPQPFSTNYTSLAVQGQNPLASDQFLAVNRLEWLAWVAGMLLHPNADRPERDWFVHVFCESDAQVVRSEHCGKLDRLPERCAEVAVRQAGIVRPPERRFEPPPAGSWQLPFETLYVAFQQFALTGFDFRLELHGYTAPRIGGNAKELQRYQQELIQLQRYIDYLASGDISFAIDSQNAKPLQGLFEQAGRSLPTFFTSSMNLFPSGATQFPQDRNPSPLSDWFNFLWLARSSSFQKCIEPGDDGARIAVWQGGNPAMASVLAIDQFIRGYTLETVPTVARRLVEVCPWLTHEEKPEMIRGIAAAFQEPERPRLVETSLGAPYVVQDILDLLVFLRGLVEFNRQVETHFPPMMPPGGSYDRIAFSLQNRPKEGRLTEADAAKLPLYRKFVRVARQEYNSDLCERVLRCIVAEVMDETDMPADDAWALTVDDFGKLWGRGRTERTLQDDVRAEATVPQRHAHQTAPSDLNPLPDPVSADPHVEQYFAQFDERMRPVQAVWERAMRTTPGATEIDGGQSIPLTTREAWDAFMAAFEFQFGTNGTTVENCNRLLRDGVFPPPGWDERAWRALAVSVGANPDDAGTGDGRTRITDAAMVAANAARLQKFAGGVAPAAGTTQPPATPTTGQGKKPVRKQGGGRKAADADLDKRVREAWDTGRYPTYADLARELRLTAKQVEKSLDRSRKKPPRPPVK